MLSRIDVSTADDLADALSAARSRLPQTRRISTPTVSVVLCAYTGARRDELLEAIRSLRRQTLAPNEVIVVIDHNTELLGWVRANAPDVHAIANRKERGLSGARNTGVRAARGDVVAFLDDDATANPNWIERLCSAYRDPAILGVGGGVLPVWERRPAWFPDEFAWVVGCSYRGLPTDPTPVRNLIGCNMSFRRQVFEQLGDFTTRLGRVAGRPLGCEETELCIRIGRQAPSRTILYDPATSVHHRVPRDRTTWRYFLSRCYSEGISKAELSRMAGSQQSLDSERSYAMRILPTGVWAELKAGRPSRAAAIVVGFCVTVAGFLAARASGRSAIQSESALSPDAAAVGVVP
jgi:glycosyltransferase involved in cell wall biosynthesis